MSDVMTRRGGSGRTGALRQVAIVCGLLAGLLTSTDLANRPPGFTPVFQRGVCFSHNHSADRGYGSAQARQSLAAIKQLGATFVSLQPIGYSFNIHHPDIIGYRGEDLTLTADHLRRAIRDAHADGLQVLLNPHLWIGIHWGQGDWRGEVSMRTPEDWTRWFAQYESFISYFAAIAQEEGVELLSVGSELQGTTLSHPDEWRALIRRVRGIYRGPCTYSANWGGEFESVPFWDELEYLGLSAYFPLGSGDRAAKGRAAADVRTRLAALHRRTGKPILFVESGFQSQADAGLDPSRWTWNSRAAVDLEAQRELYEVWMETFWQEPWFYGVYWWQWFADPSFSGAGDNSYVFRGKPAEAVVRRFFQSPSPVERRLAPR
jgi:hypothetical protein